MHLINSPRPGFASGGQGAYQGAMQILPRPVSPRHALADLKLMFAPDRPYRWTLLGVSAVISAVMFWAVFYDARPPKPERQIYYVESWMNDRKDSDIIRQQKIDLADYEAGLRDEQKKFQKFADQMGIDWRADEKRQREQRAAVIAAIQKRLDKRLADALAREAAEKASGKIVTGEEAP